MKRFIYRAGWPGRYTRRRGRRWIWIGPYVVGSVRNWDTEEA